MAPFVEVDVTSFHTLWDSVVYVVPALVFPAEAHMLHYSSSIDIVADNK